MEQEINVGLVSIYTDPNPFYSALYQLLAEREDYESISHNKMPTWEEHKAFLDRKPYKSWFVVLDQSAKERTIVGSIYLSWQNEIGIAIFKKYRRNGFGRVAIQKLMSISDNELYYLANINPINDKSKKLFEGLGFTLLQVTYKLERKKDDPSS